MTWLDYNDLSILKVKDHKNTNEFCIKVFGNFKF